MAGRIEIDDVAPVVSGGRYPAKAVVGEVVPGPGDGVARRPRRGGGHAGGALPRHRYPQLAEVRRRSGSPASPCRSRMSSTRRAQVKPQALPMSPGRTRRVPRPVHPRPASGLWTFRVDGWGDPIATWRHAVDGQAGRRPERRPNCPTICWSARSCWSGPRRACPAQTAYPLIEAAARAARARRPVHPCRRRRSPPDVDRTARRSIPLRELVTRGEQYGVWVDRPLARFSSWYELFPRSTGGWDDNGKPGARHVRHRDQGACPAIARMGFDVVYLPPIHPIGKVHRKGRNNTRDRRRPDDVGSPWAIGSDEGGHDAIHPRARAPSRTSTTFVAAARDAALEVALDLALQCAPDHPWAQGPPGVVHRAARRHHRLRREPAEEVPGHLPAELRQRPGGPLRRRCCGWCGTGSRTASRSSGSTTRTPSRRTSGRG